MQLNKITNPKVENNRNYKGMNFFEKKDIKLIQILTRGEFNINGFRAKDIKKWCQSLSASQISRILKRLRVLGIIKKVGNSYKYYLTIIGKAAITTGLKLKNIVIIPSLCA